ncbi:unnamed protein product [Acanthoscelides obtectus]|uniref:THAP-type domain-containing protein n=1 Tax=Acanthoscelides obtectus TaxID=200917 RepID=A0A9P0PWT6_ACAOB|nr:unnamed protein product [Acanthoscelides obtectus]CAK1678405.1 hypothetical protein AOBTE_LOCUS31875 [Acanthoscelides obtectus]
MPYKCGVPNCAGNYGKGPKVHVFSFPLNENCRKRWLNAIPRSDLVVTKTPQYAICTSLRTA